MTDHLISQYSEHVDTVNHLRDAYKQLGSIRLETDALDDYQRDILMKVKEHIGMLYNEVQRKESSLYVQIWNMEEEH